MLITYQTQPAGKVLGITLSRTRGVNLPWRDSLRTRDAVLLAYQLLCRNLAGGAFLVRVPHLGPERPRLVLFAF